MPSILVETGFITHKEEEEFLNSEAGQDQIVGNITNALKNYVSILEKQQTTPDNAMKTGAIQQKISYDLLKKMDEHEIHSTK
jgi:N-acetylmuramoyl-L-alanine amidase